jgi:hypothetical protein
MEQSGRSKNFSTNEINLLVMLGDSKKKLLSQKKTGTLTNKEKAKMWGNIALSFNSQTIEADQFETWTVKNYASDKTNLYYVGYFHEFPPVREQPCFWKV